MTHGYENTGIAEIRRILRDDYGIVNDEILKQTKKPLVELLIKLEQEKNADEEMNKLGYQLEEVEEETETPFQKVDLPKGKESQWENTPELYSPQWFKYVMSLFDKSELKNNHPTCDGCRRLVNQLIGPILESGIAQVIPATHENLVTATVVFQIKVSIKNEDHPLYNNNQTILHMEDVADCNTGNTDLPYSKHLSATASTRAEGRILRKLLGLKTIVAEETSEQETKEEWEPNTFISPSQEACINLMCDRLKLNVEEFMNSGKGTYADIKEVPYNTAIAMIKELTNLQRKIT